LQKIKIMVKLDWIFFAKHPDEQELPWPEPEPEPDPKPDK
jgi:hypothetical protein